MESQPKNPENFQPYTLTNMNKISQYQDGQRTLQSADFNHKETYTFLVNNAQIWKKKLVCVPCIHYITKNSKVQLLFWPFLTAVKSIIIIFHEQNELGCLLGKNSDDFHCLRRPLLFLFVIFDLLMSMCMCPITLKIARLS